MRLLLTNDDGIFAPGLRALALALQKDHEIIVCAPDRECSGVSHSFTFLSPIRLKQVELEGVNAPSYSVSGMPVDCVKLGTVNLMDKAPDMVVSGVNHGGNLGTDVLYSGTVSAAMEAAILGINALAVSCVGFPAQHFETSARLAASLLDKLHGLKAPAGTVFNLNVPDLPEREVKGLKLATIGNMEYDNLYEKRLDPRGNEYYWLSDSLIENPKLQEGSDIYWMDEGYATLTPIMYDLTNHAYLKTLQTHFPS